MEIAVILVLGYFNSKDTMLLLQVLLLMAPFYQEELQHLGLLLLLEEVSLGILYLILLIIAF
jgi:hypothetical protein